MTIIWMNSARVLPNTKIVCHVKRYDLSVRASRYVFLVKYIIFLLRTYHVSSINVFTSYVIASTANVFYMNNVMTPFRIMLVVQ